MNYYLEKFRNAISIRLGQRLIDHRADDLYIAAFPRSGSTWLRTMLAAVKWPDEELVPLLYNTRMPAVSIRNVSLIRKVESPRLIMTHGLWTPEMKRAIYVVRDGRDALVSFYHYKTTRAGVEMPFDEFLKGYANGRYGKRWEQNVQSWLGEARHRLGENLHIVHFEKLKSDTKKTLEGVCHFADIPVTDEMLERAAKLSSIESMKAIEQRESGKDLAPDASFYRGGRTGQWQDYLVGEELMLFSEKTKVGMNLAGYPQ